MAGDPAKARELLAEAGAEGIELRLAVRNTAIMSTVGQIIQANLQEVGIRRCRTSWMRAPR